MLMTRASSKGLPTFLAYAAPLLLRFCSALWVHSWRFCSLFRLKHHYFGLHLNFFFHTFSSPCQGFRVKFKAIGAVVAHQHGCTLTPRGYCRVAGTGPNICDLLAVFACHSAGQLPTTQPTGFCHLWSIVPYLFVQVFRPLILL